MSNNESGYTKCKICKEDIHCDAIICTHCNSFQNWRRHLGISSSFLSILIALISVLTVFVTVVSNSTIKNDSDIDASIVNWQRAFMVYEGKMVQILVANIFVTNSGKKPGAIKSISVKGDSENGFRHFQDQIIEIKDKYSNLGVDPQIVEPSKTLLLKRYLITDLDVGTFEKVYSNSQLLLEVINFSGANQDIELKIENKIPILLN